MTPSKRPAARALAHRRVTWGRLARDLSFKNIGAVYVGAVIFVVFTSWAPATFPTWDTVRQILNDNAVTGLVALALVVPLSARVFDLSVGYTASLSGVVAAYCLAHGVSVVPSVLIATGAALLVGLLNAMVVVVLRVDSFIGTLATGSLVQSFITLVTNDISINDPRVAGSFSRISQSTVIGLTLPVLYLVIVVAVIWFVLEHTVAGRRLYAVGFNPEAARLVGVAVNRLRFVSLLVSATIAGIAGVVLASSIGSGSPTAGTPYLLSAYAAAFLGATQLRPGRFNAWGTMLAVLLLGTGVVGLGLAAAPTYAPSMFTGVVLISALAITSAETRGLRQGWRRSRERVLRLRRSRLTFNRTAAIRSDHEESTDMNEN